jgi:hypothetical protein
VPAVGTKAVTFFGGLAALRTIRAGTRRAATITGNGDWLRLGTPPGNCGFDVGGCPLATALGDGSLDVVKIVRPCSRNWSRLECVQFAQHGSGGSHQFLPNSLVVYLGDCTGFVIEIEDADLF